MQILRCHFPLWQDVSILAKCHKENNNETKFECSQYFFFPLKAHSVFSRTSPQIITFTVSLLQATFSWLTPRTTWPNGSCTLFVNSGKKRLLEKNTNTWDNEMYTILLINNLTQWVPDLRWGLRCFAMQIIKNNIFPYEDVLSFRTLSLSPIAC